MENSSVTSLLSLFKLHIALRYITVSCKPASRLTMLCHILVMVFKPGPNIAGNIIHLCALTLTISVHSSACQHASMFHWTRVIKR